MILKTAKWVVLGGVGLGLAGSAIFGTDAVSYFRTSVKSVRSTVKDSVPMELELARAKDLLDDILPEMHANIKMIAQQEVEIGNLKGDIEQSRKSLAEQAMRVQKLRDCLATSAVSFTFGGLNYSREELKTDLAHKFDAYKEAELVLNSKQRLLENRQKALAAGVQAIERTKSQKTMLENKIAALEAQFRVVQAASTNSNLAINNSKIAQTEKVIAQIKERLDVAERVLAHEAKFTNTIPVDVVNEKDLVMAVDEHFGTKTAAEPKAVEAKPEMRSEEKPKTLTQAEKAESNW
ncbi:MAG: hypothetical protein ACM359_09865 [Bacillota bacterium]